MEVNNQFFLPLWLDYDAMRFEHRKISMRPEF